MTLYNQPVYLDTNLLEPLASTYELYSGAAVRTMMRKSNEKAANASGSVRVATIAEAGFGGSCGGESESLEEIQRQTSTVTVYNRLLDKLRKESDGLTLNCSQDAICRNRHAEFAASWEISSVTDLGQMIDAFVRILAEDASILDARQMPQEVLTQLMHPEAAPNRVILQGQCVESCIHKFILLVNSDFMTPGSTLDDLEGDRNIFAYVDAFKAEGETFDLTNYLLRGVNRSLRRAFPLKDLIAAYGAGVGSPLSLSDIRVDGPVIVFRPIGIC